MTIAARNTQKENNDVYNFWRWPLQTHDYGWISDGRVIPIQISYWTWSRFAGFGIGGNNVQENVRNVTAASVEVKSQSYTGCVFVDMPPGSYHLSFDTTEQMEFRDIKYVDAGNGMSRYADCKSLLLGAGYNEIQLNISKDFITCLGFGGYNCWAKLTNVRIVEAVL